LVFAPRNAAQPEDIMRFIDPLRSYSQPVRWIFTAGTALFGIVVLAQSYIESGQSRDWRISAGVSALAFTLVSFTTRLPQKRSLLIYKPIEVIIFILAGIGGLAVLQSFSTESEWARQILLEGGIACLFVSGVDLLLNSVVDDFKRSERQERQIWDEFALQTGMFFNLSVWSYYWMREFLDELPAGETHSAADRTARLLRYAQKAADLPEHLKPFNNSGIMALIKRDFRVTRLVAGYAQAHHLTDAEFHYLRVLAEMRTNPDWPQDELLTNETMTTWLENAAEQIARSRPTGLKKLLGWLAPHDPLNALDEMRHYIHSRYGANSPPPTLDRTAYDDEVSESG
jgi:hypothetical protein